MDAIVIGAGLAGLSAAARLVENGRAVTVLEARERIGGRIWSESSAGSAIELGPEWFDHSGGVATLLRAAGARVTARHGDHLQLTPRGWEPSQQQKVVRQFVKTLRKAGAPDLPLTEALRTGAADLPQTQQDLIPYVEGFHAADPDRLSTQWLVEVEANQSADASDARTPDGLSRAVEALERRLAGRAPIRLGSRVTEIRWQPGRVEIAVEGRAESISASCVIVTVPLSILKSGRLRFEPELTDKRPALDLLQMGHVKKVVLDFRRRFWQDTRISNALFLQDFSQPFPTWWMPADPMGAALVGWVGGPPAARLEGNSDQITDLALASLSGLLDLPRTTVERELSRVWFHDWSADPNSLGAYSYVGAGGLGAPEVLAQPVEGTIFLAGEATCSHGYNATMDGALQSGERAAVAALAVRRK